MNNRILKITIIASLGVIGTAIAGCSATKSTPTSTSSSGGMAEIRGVRIGELPFEDASVEEQEQFLEKQRRVREQQEQELQDLKRQQFHDQYFKSQYPTQR